MQRAKSTAKLLLFTFLLLLPSHNWAFAQTSLVPDPAPSKTDVLIPKQTIIGAEQPIDFGNIINLSISPIDITKYPFLTKTKINWHILEGNSSNGYALLPKDKSTIIFWNSGDRVAFGTSSPNNKILVMVYISYVYLIKDSKGVLTEIVVEDSGLLSREVKFKGVVPPEPIPPVPPGPTPPPPIPPNPQPIPDGVFKLQRFVISYVRDYGPKDPTEIKKGCRASQQAYEGIIASIGAGAYRTPEDILIATNKLLISNLQKEGGNPSDWSTFGQKLQAYLISLDDGGKLKTIEDYKVAWQELSDGFGYILKNNQSNSLRSKPYYEKIYP